MTSDLKIQWETCSVPDLDKDRLLECYNLVRKIRPLYIASGEGWVKKQKLAEMESTPGLEYIIGVNSSDKVVCFVSFVLDDTDDHDEPTTFIYELHVSPDMRGNKLGTALMTKVKALARNSITLRVFACNKRAIKFYRMQGFTVDSTISTPAVLFMSHV